MMSAVEPMDDQGLQMITANFIAGYALFHWANGIKHHSCLASSKHEQVEAINASQAAGQGRQHAGKQAGIVAQRMRSLAWRAGKPRVSHFP